MVQPPHFIQSAGAPVFIGQGRGELACRCGQSVLVRGYDPRNFLAVDFQCAACGAITTTPGLSALDSPATEFVPLARTGETPAEPAGIAAGTVLVGRDELDRLVALNRPRHPATDDVTVTADLLDAVTAEYDRLTDGGFARHRPVAGPRAHMLVWAIQTLRASLDDPDWACVGTSEASVATAVVGAFRHFRDCWSHHPYFLMMAAAAGDAGFSLQGLAPFAAAKCLADSGNTVGFLNPNDGSGRVRDFVIATGLGERHGCAVDVFGQFEWPSVKPWDPASLKAALLDRMLASKARLNLKHPGLLVLSPGASMEAMDQPLVDAIDAILHTQGRRYRGLTAVCLILPKIVPTARRNSVSFGYSFYPIANPRHMAASTIQIGRRGD